MKKYIQAAFGLLFLCLLTSCGSASSSSSANSSTWAYIDDVCVEPNGVQDLLATIGIASTHGQPLFYGSTHEEGRRGCVGTAARIVSSSGGGAPVLAGAPRAGINQISQVSKAIYDAAKFGSISIANGGSYTDIAMAVTQAYRENTTEAAQKIIANIRVYGIQPFNAAQDQKAFDYLIANKVSMNLFIGTEYKAIITGADRAWLEKHMRPKSASSIVLREALLRKAAQINLGQTGVATPARLADVMTALWIFHGKRDAMNQGFAYFRIEQGLANIQ